MKRYAIQPLAAFLAVWFCAPLWAVGIAPPGVPNFHQVNEHIYRSGQPADRPETWGALAGLGIKTVINLRLPGEQSKTNEAKAVESAGMQYISVPMSGFQAPNDGQIARLLALLEADSPGAILVHCRRGADRTGTVIAAYRMDHDGWPAPKALQEAVADGMSWVELAMKRYILHFHPIHPAPA